MGDTSLMTWMPKDKSIKEIQDNLKNLAESPALRRILEHSNKCKFCQTLQSMIGSLIESHMEEEFEREKLT